MALPLPGLIESAIAAVVTFIGATALSTVGFGIGMTTIPALLFVFDPRTVVIVINTVSLLLFVLIIYQNRAEIPVRRVGLWSVAGLLAVPVGVVALRDSDTALLKISIAAITMALTVMVAVGARVPVPRGLAAGLVVAFGVSVTLNALGIGGPIMALYVLAQGWSRNAVRGALALYFLFVESAGVVGYAVAGLLTPERIALILIVTPPALLGFWLATHLVRRMNEAMFRRATVAVILISCAMVLAREGLALLGDSA